MGTVSNHAIFEIGTLIHPQSASSGKKLQGEENKAFRVARIAVSFLFSLVIPDTRQS